LDVPKGEENKLLPAKKVGVPQKLNLNQSKAYIKVIFKILNSAE